MGPGGRTQFTNLAVVVITSSYYTGSTTSYTSSSYNNYIPHETRSSNTGDSTGLGAAYRLRESQRHSASVEAFFETIERCRKGAYARLLPPPWSTIRRELVRARWSSTEYRPRDSVRRAIDVAHVTGARAKHRELGMSPSSVAGICCHMVSLATSFRPGRERASARGRSTIAARLVGSCFRGIP